MGMFSNKEGSDNKADVQNVTNARNWYSDRYETILVQRNLLFLLSLVGLVVVLVSVFLMGQVAIHKTVEPMIVEIESKSGITNIVNPMKGSQIWLKDDTVSKYFLVEYIRARETYDIASYLYNYNTVVKLLSSYSVYQKFTKYINNPETSPVAKYKADNYTILKIRSIQFLGKNKNGYNAEIRFAIEEKYGNKKVYNKIVYIVWNYISMNLNFDQRMVNPLGFQIKSYAISGESNV